MDVRVLVNTACLSYIGFWFLMMFLVDKGVIRGIGLCGTLRRCCSCVEVEETTLYEGCE